MFKYFVGYQDLIINGDFKTSVLYWNNGDGTFTDATESSGVGTDENGMGSTVADYDLDGRQDWFLSSIHMSAEQMEPFREVYLGGGIIFGHTGNRLYRFVTRDVCEKCLTPLRGVTQTNTLFHLIELPVSEHVSNLHYLKRIQCAIHVSFNQLLMDAKSFLLLSDWFRVSYESCDKTTILLNFVQMVISCSCYVRNDNILSFLPFILIRYFLFIGTKEVVNSRTRLTRSEFAMGTGDGAHPSLTSTTMATWISSTRMASMIQR